MLLLGQKKLRDSLEGKGTSPGKEKAISHIVSTENFTFLNKNLDGPHYSVVARLLKQSRRVGGVWDARERQAVVPFPFIVQRRWQVNP